MSQTVVIGAGPAGLTAGLELGRLGVPAVVLEQDDVVGGISRTEEYKGFRFDIGGHRFFTKVPEVEALWHELLGDELLWRSRLSRIYYRGKFFHYPLKPLNALFGLGPVEATRIIGSYAKARIRPSPEEDTFEQWVVNRFGRRLYEIFFETYTEKVWGIPPSEIGAEWAAQRIKNLDLSRAIWSAFSGSFKGSAETGENGEIITTLIDNFHYPRLGPGQLWERCRERAAEVGTETRTGARVVGLGHRNGRVESVRYVERQGEGTIEVPADHVISSMPLASLVRSLDPLPPQAVLAAADALEYRDFVTVVLIVRREHLFPDNWIYIHEPSVRVGRIQNFKNWSPAMVPDAAYTSLGLEYFTNTGDDLWNAQDEDLLRLGRTECERLGLLRGAAVEDGTVLRMPKAYPVYDQGYRRAVETLRRYLERFENLACVGRNGQHRYNNQDHSMLTALYAARNRVGAEHDLWAVNTEAEYHESGSASGAQRSQPTLGSRSVPTPTPRGISVASGES